MIYIITSGEHSDFTIKCLLKSPDDFNSNFNFDLFIFQRLIIAANGARKNTTEYYNNINKYCKEKCKEEIDPDFIDTIVKDLEEMGFKKIEHEFISVNVD
jgi:hypothetical protein